MVAIITDKLKRNMINKLIEDVDSTGSNYYIGIGRSEQWDSTDTVVNPLASARDERQFRSSLQAMKLGEDISFVVPRNNWSSGTVYSGYDDAVAGYPTNKYYVMTEQNFVYVCLKQGRNSAGVAVPSIIAPTVTTMEPFETSDGYVWKYLFQQGAVPINKFLTSNFMPLSYIETDSDASGDVIKEEQRKIQKYAIRGEITDIVVTAGGSGYTSPPTVGINGVQRSYGRFGLDSDPKTALATAIIHNGQLVNITMNDSGTGKAFGRGYDAADITITGGGGSGATARAVISPYRGWGRDPREDLKSTSVMINTKLAGTEGDTFLIGNDYRQVALIKNPATSPDSARGINDSDARLPLLSLTSSNALKSLKLASAPAGSFTADKVIVGGSSAAKAVLDQVDSNRLYFHQTEDTGFINFTGGETLTEIDGAGNGTLDSAAAFLDSADVNVHTGEILYIDNRASITRSSAQTEDIKVVIQF